MSERIQKAINFFEKQLDDALMFPDTKRATQRMLSGRYRVAIEALREKLQCERQEQQEPLTCEGCEWKPNMLGVTRCQRCKRFPLLEDRYEPKGDAT